MKSCVVITGASKGIGKEIALRFAQEGQFHLILIARDISALEQVKTQLQNIQPEIDVYTIACDLRDTNAIQSLEFPKLPIQVILHNAGSFLPKTMAETSSNELLDEFALNVIAPFELTKKLAPAIEQSERGLVVNICSIASEIGLPHAMAYTMSKHALLGFGRALREQWKEDHIAVTNVILGSTYSTSWEDSDIAPDRLVNPKDVAELIVSLSKLHPSSVVETIRILPQKGQV